MQTRESLACVIREAIVTESHLYRPLIAAQTVHGCTQHVHQVSSFLRRERLESLTSSPLASACIKHHGR